MHRNLSMSLCIRQQQHSMQGARLGHMNESPSISLFLHFNHEMKPFSIVAPSRYTQIPCMSNFQFGNHSSLRAIRLLPTAEACQM